MRPIQPGTFVIGIVSGRWAFPTLHAIAADAPQVGTRQRPHSVYGSATYKAECGRTVMPHYEYSAPLDPVPYVVGDSFRHCKTCDRKVQAAEKVS